MTVSYAVDRFLEPSMQSALVCLMMGTETALDQLSFALTLGPRLALFASAKRLLARAFACLVVSLENCSTALQKHPSRGLDDPFSLPNEREVTTSTSMGSERPRDPSSLDLELRIL